MTVSELLEKAQFLVDEKGNKKAIVFEYEIWEELLTLLEDLEDEAEIKQLRESDKEVISWQQAKRELRAGGVDV